MKPRKKKSFLSLIMLFIISICYYYVFWIALENGQHNEFMPQSVKDFIYYSDFKQVLKFMAFAIPVCILIAFQTIMALEMRSVGITRTNVFVGLSIFNVLLFISLFFVMPALFMLGPVIVLFPFGVIFAFFVMVSLMRPGHTSLQENYVITPVDYSKRQ